MWRPQPRSGGTDRRRRGGSSGREAAGPDGLEHLMPSGSLCKKKLAKRPGYMRPEAQRQLQFQSLGACNPFSPEEFKHGKGHCEELEEFSLCGQRNNNVEFLRCSSIASSAVVLADGATTLGTTVNMPGSCKNLSCSKNPQSENIVSIYPAETTSKGVSTVCGTWQTCCRTEVSEPQKMHGLDQAEVNNNCEYQNREAVSCSVGLPDSFSSSFSFIQLSLNSASTVSNAEGKASAVVHPSSARDLQEPGETRRTQEHAGALCCFSRSSEDLKSENETTASDKLQDCETVSLSDTDATFSCSTDSSDAASAGSSVTSGYESSFTVSDQNWDTLIKRYEPALLDCQLGNRSTLKVKSMILQIRRLQQKAIEADDYDKG